MIRGRLKLRPPAQLEERLERYRHFLKHAPEPRAHRRAPGVDALLGDLIERCLAIDPKTRYPNVEAVLEGLNQRRRRITRRPFLLLGTATPALVVLVMALIANRLFQDTMSVAQDEVLERALESNHFAARSIAERFGLEVEKRWRLLEQEAQAPQLRRWLALDLRPENANNRQAADELNEWLKGRHAFWDEHFIEGTKASFWFVDDRTGYQRASSPRDDRYLNKYFGFRDYFHGLGLDLPRTHSAPKPIGRPHRSMIYKRSGRTAYTVAFSVPVPSLDPNASSPIGVLGLAHDLGEFTKFKGSRNQFAVLIDVRKDEQGREGMIVEHPYLDELRAHPEQEFKPYFSAQVVDRMEKPKGILRERSDEEPSKISPDMDFPGNYQDPVGGYFDKRWLATLEPVLLVRLDKNLRDPGWVVLVQESYEEAVRPLESLHTNLINGALFALALLVVTVTAVWGLVILIMNEAPGRGMVALLRQKAGLRSANITGGSSASGQAKADSAPAQNGTPLPRNEG